MKIIETISVWFALLLTGQVQGASQYGDADGPPSKLNPSLSCVMFGDDGCRGTCTIIARLYGCEVSPFCRKGMYCECNEVYHFPNRDVSADKFKNLPFKELWNYRFQNSLQSMALRDAIMKDDNMRDFALALLQDPHMTGEEVKTALNDRYPQLKQVRDLPSVDRGEKNHLESTGNDLEYDNLGQYFKETLTSWGDRAREKAEECRYKRRIMDQLDNVKDEEELKSIMRQVLMSGNDKLYNFLNSYLRRRKLRFDNASLLQQPRRGRYGRGGCRRGGRRNRPDSEEMESDMSPWSRGGYRRKPIRKTVILRKGEKPVTMEADEDEIIEVTVINELLDGANGSSNEKIAVSNKPPESIRKPPEVQVPQKSATAIPSPIANPADDAFVINDQDLTPVPATLPPPINSQLYPVPDEISNKPATSTSSLVNSPGVHSDNMIPAQPSMYRNPLQSQYSSSPSPSFLPLGSTAPPSAAPNVSVDNNSYLSAKWPTEYVPSSQSIIPSGFPWLNSPYSAPPSTDLAQATSSALPTSRTTNFSPSSYQTQLPNWMRYIPGYGSSYIPSSSGLERPMNLVSGYIPPSVLPYMYGNAPSQFGNGFLWGATPQMASNSAGIYEQPMQNNLPIGTSTSQPLDSSVKVSQDATPGQPHSYSFSYSSGDNSGHSDSNSNSAGSLPRRYNANRPLSQSEIISPSSMNIPNPVKSFTDMASDYMQQGMSNRYPGQITETINERLPNGRIQPSSILNNLVEALKPSIPATSTDAIQNSEVAATQTMNEKGPLSYVTSSQNMIPGTDRVQTYLPETPGKPFLESTNPNFNYDMVNEMLPVSSTIFQNIPEAISQSSIPSVPLSANLGANNENRDVLSGGGSQLAGSVSVGAQNQMAEGVGGQGAAYTSAVQNDVLPPNPNKRNKSAYYIVVDDDEDEHQGIEAHLQNAFKNLNPSLLKPTNFPIRIGT